MKKFNNVKKYSKYLNEEFELGLNDFGLDDFEEFVENNKYEIFIVQYDVDVEDDILKMNDKYYWMVERYEGIRFVEIDEEEIEWLKNELNF